MKNYVFSDDEVNIETIPLQVPMHALYASRDIYVNYPPFQRDYVWGDDFKADLIDSYIRGLPVGDILISNRLDGITPGKWVLDGQQRLTTLMQFMAAMMADKAHKPIPKDRDGRTFFYRRLNERQEQRFLNSIVSFRNLIGVDEKTLSVIFLRVQNQIPLSPAEKLHAASSEAQKVAQRIYEHAYFTSEDGIYNGRTKRMQPFHMAAYPTVIEMYAPFADMSSPRLQINLSGAKDNLVYAGMGDTAIRRMDAVSRLFNGVESGAKPEIIIQYQAIWLLEFIGADLDNTPDGALVPWYRSIEDLNSQLRRAGFFNLFAMLPNAKTQRDYWKKWLEQIVYSAAVTFHDQREALAQLQRVTGWLRNDGICHTCNAQHTKLADVKKHIFLETDRHRPGAENCYTASLRAVPQQAAV